MRREGEERKSGGEGEEEEKERARKKFDLRGES